MSKKQRRWTIAISVIVILVALRLALPYWVKNFINEKLADMNGYAGHIHELDFKLYRGIAVVDSVIIKKANGEVDVPFMDIKTVKVTLQPEALVKGSIVTEFMLIKPKLNFVEAGSDAASQYGKGVDWMKQFKSLTPLRINHLEAKNGVLSYRDLTTNPKVDVFMKDINFTLSNLAGVLEYRDSLLPSSLYAQASTFGGKLEIEGGLNTIGNSSDVDLNASFEKIDLTSLNDLAKSYADFDFEAGHLNFYFEIAKRDSSFQGYAKPLFTNVDVASPGTEKDEGFFRKIWEGLVGTGFEILENQDEEQTGTRIPFSGSTKNPQTSTWVIIKNTFGNAFVEAFNRELNYHISLKDIEE